MTQEAKNMAAAEKIMNIVSCEASKRVMKKFDGFVPIDTDMLSDFDDIGFCFTDATPSALDNLLNVSVLNYANDDFPDMCIKARKADLKSIRKMTNKFSTDAYILECIHFDTGFTKSVPVEVKKNQKFSEAKIIVPYGHVGNLEVEKETQRSLSVLGGIQFSLENYSSVYLKPDNAVIGFTLPLYSLSAVKGIFKMREIEPGRKRRTALKHFVAEHLRKLPSDPNETIKIARYLRGTEKFDWDGFECTINIPASWLNERAEQNGA